MERNRAEKEKRDLNKGKFLTVFGFIVVMIFPITLLILANPPQSTIDLRKMLTEAVTFLSIAVLLYCGLRIVMILLFNKYLKQIPLPTNTAVRYTILAVAGLAIGFFTPIWVAALWIVSGILAYFLGMFSYAKQ